MAKPQWKINLKVNNFKFISKKMYVSAHTP